MKKWHLGYQPIRERVSWVGQKPILWIKSEYLISHKIVVEPRWNGWTALLPPFGRERFFRFSSRGSSCSANQRAGESERVKSDGYPELIGFQSNFDNGLKFRAVFQLIYTVTTWLYPGWTSCDWSQPSKSHFLFWQNPIWGFRDSGLNKSKFKAIWIEKKGKKNSG